MVGLGIIFIFASLYFLFSCIIINIFLFLPNKTKTHRRHKNALENIRKGRFGDDNKTKFIAN